MGLYRIEWDRMGQEEMGLDGMTWEGCMDVWDGVKWNGTERDRIEGGGVGGDEMGSYRMQWDRRR